MFRNKNSEKSLKSKDKKLKNNFFSSEPDSSSSDLQEILNKGGLNDINFKKQVLINKIKNKEIDPDKYTKFIDALGGAEADDVAMEMPSKSKKNSSQMPVVNFNTWNSNLLIVNG